MPKPQRLTPADVMTQLGYEAIALGQRMAGDARTHHEVEARMHESDRIGQAIVRAGRRAPARVA